MFNVRKALSDGQGYNPRFVYRPRHGMCLPRRGLSICQNSGVISMYRGVDAILDTGAIQLMCCDTRPVHMIQSIRMSPSDNNIDPALWILNHRVVPHDRPGVLLLL